MTITKDQVFKKLQGYARRWGGDIVKVTQTGFKRSKCGIAPFTDWDLGCKHSTKTVFFSSHCEPDDIEAYATGIIHEMGHVFASKVAPNRQKPSAEFDFFGWEVLLAEKIGLTRQQFYKGQAEYAVNDQGDRIDDFLADTANLPGDRDERLSRLTGIMNERIQYARSQGMIKNGRPVSTRHSVFCGRMGTSHAKASSAAWAVPPLRWNP